MGQSSYVSPDCPPPFAAQMAEIEVDVDTGQVTVVKLVMAVDCGVAINPITASGQVEGGMIQALGYAHCEEYAFDESRPHAQRLVRAVQDLPGRRGARDRGLPGPDHGGLRSLRGQGGGRDPQGRCGPGRPQRHRERHRRGHRRPAVHARAGLDGPPGS